MPATTPITPAQLGNLGTTPVVINTGEGTLTLTGFNPTTGVVSYTYSAPAQNSPTDVLDTIPVIVTDTAGVTATDNLDILIKDTAPVARPDTNSVTEDTNTSASGNVINAGPGTDTLGADATVVSAVSGTAAGTVGGNTAGTYGTLALSNTGGYTYTLANTNPAVQALKTGESLVDTFTYTIRDADGDTSTTTLTITINGQTEGIPTVTIPNTNGAEAGDNTIVEAATGLGGNSLQHGFAPHSNEEYLSAVCRAVKKTKVSVLLLPGLGTMRELQSAYDCGARSVHVATHCTEAALASAQADWRHVPLHVD